MFTVELKNGKTYRCAETETLFLGAKTNGLLLEHSCLTARCSSCKVQVIEGDTINVQQESVLSQEERDKGYVLSCNVKPLTDVKLNTVDLGDLNIPTSKTLPAKIQSIEQLTSSVLKIILRLPPTQEFNFLSGQYVNLIKGSIKRSYSLASTSSGNNELEFLIKNYEGGAMSTYFFKEAQKNDLLRMEGPLGTFFLRENTATNLVFLATGTGIAPVKAILEQIFSEIDSYNSKKIYVLWGGRYLEDLFWKPILEMPNLNFIPVLSRENVGWQGAMGYIQDILLEIIKDFSSTEVYACGSNQMIESAHQLLISRGLPESRFHSDAFVQTN